MTTTYGYDPKTGQLASVDYSDSTPDISYTHTRTGRLKTVSDAIGTRVFSYTALDKLGSETLPSGFYGATTVLARAHDALGRDGGYSFSWDGNTVQSATCGYDASGRFGSVASNGDTFSYGYLANSDLVNTLSGPADILQTRAYETTRNLVDYIENKVDTTTVSMYDYTNDVIGRRTSVQKSGTAFPATDTVVWGYDDRSQVTTAVAGNEATYDYTYAYDPIGNRTNYVTKETGTAVATAYDRNQLNQYTSLTGQSDPIYDDDGNMTLMPTSNGEWTLTWNGENRLVAAESSSARLESAYDYLGRRVRKRTYTGTTGNWTLSEDRRFLYDGWNLIAEFVVGGETTSINRTHAWGLDLSRSLRGAGGVGGLLRTVEYNTSAASYYPTYDANGNVTEYLDSEGDIVAHYEYSPFGVIWRTDGPGAASLPFRFSTRYQDSVPNSYYYGYRYYSSTIGRWISRDPKGELSFSLLVSEMSENGRKKKGHVAAHCTPYEFVENNPSSSIDVLGLDRYITQFDILNLGGSGGTQLHVGVAVDTWGKNEDGEWVKTGVVTYDFSVDYTAGALNILLAAIGTAAGMIVETEGLALEKPITIESTPEQDMKMKEMIDEQKKNPPFYNGLFHQCLFWAVGAIQYGMDQ